MLVDAANEHELLLEMCRELGVRQVLETHGHWDHIQAVPAVRDAGYAVSVSAADAGMLPSYDLLLEDGAVLEVGRLRLRDDRQPRPHAGSVSFSSTGRRCCFSGDTLFPGGPGNTKFPGRRLRHHHPVHRASGCSPVRPDTIVLPGHGERHHHRERAAPTSRNGSTGAGDATPRPVRYRP